jgi:hypothetical protein
MAIRSVKADKYSVVILAMLTNIIITAGTLRTTDTTVRLKSIEACLKELFRSIT